MMQIFLEQGADIDAKSVTHFWPLQAAASHGKTEAVRWLLAHGADPNRCESGGTALGSACHHGDPELVELLLEAGARAEGVTGRDLGLAAISGSTRAVRAILEAGVDASVRAHAAEMAQASGHAWMAVCLRGESVDFDEAPHWEGSFEVEPQANHKGTERQIDEALVIIKGGELENDIDRLDEHGESLLTAAIRERRPSIALALLEAGSAPNAGDDRSRSRPLTQAIDNGEWAVFEALLERGAEVNSEDRNRWTPLMAAANYGRPRVVEQLLTLGADPYRETVSYQTAIDEAKGPYRDSIRETIRAAMKRKPATIPRALGFEGPAIASPVQDLRGIVDFLEYLSQGEPDWSIVLIHADVANVTPILADVRGAVRVETDIASRAVLPGETGTFVLQLQGHPWTLEIRRVFGIDWDPRSNLESDAKALSIGLAAEVVTFSGSDTAGVFELTRYRAGAVCEEVAWYEDGTLANFASRLDNEPPSAGEDWSAIDTYVRGLDAYVPPCRMRSGPGVAELVLHDIPPRSVVQLDYLVLAE